MQYTKIVLSVGALVLSALFFFACEKNEVVTEAAQVGKLEQLIALGAKMDPSDAEVKQYNADFEALTLEELIEYRKIELAQLAAGYQDTEVVRGMVAENLQQWTAFHKAAVAKFGKPGNQLTAEQQEVIWAMFETSKTGAGAVDRASCPVVFSNINLPRGNTSSSLNVTNAREVDLGGVNDCDCQIAFATTNTNFRRLFPVNTTASNLLNDFGGTVAGRRVTTGGSAGTYAILGKLRVTFRYPSAVFSGCNVLLGQYRLTNN